jgi:hypothetical protein
MEYYYKINGLLVSSEIELPEAYQVEPQTPEVEIKYGAMPDFIRELRAKKYNYSIYHKEYKWFYVDGEGSFFIRNGISIIVEPEDTADDKHIRSILLGSAFGSIMYQRDIIAIHGAAVVWKDKAIIVSGNSGTGKSTISTALRIKGSLFLADDTVAIKSTDGAVYANPSFPQQKLCTDTALDFGYDLSKLTLLDENKEKYAVNLLDSFCSESKEVKALVCLEIHEGRQVMISEITGNAKLQYILKYLYSYRDYISASMNTEVFRRCLEVARQIPVFQVKRPVDRNLVGEIADQIMALI